MIRSLQKRLMKFSFSMIFCIVSLVSSTYFLLFYMTTKQNYTSSALSATGNVFANLNSKKIIETDFMYAYIQQGYNIIIKDKENIIAYTTDDFSLNQKEIMTDFDHRMEQFDLSSPKNQFINFTYSAKDKNKYHVCYGYIYYRNTPIKIAVMLSLSSFSSQTKRVIGVTVLMALLAMLLLGAGTYYLIQHLLIPVEKTQRSQSQFTISASHELKSPLAVILSGVCALDTEKNITANGKKQISLIKTECTYMSSLVEELLSLAKSETGSLSYTFSECFIEDILITCYDHFEAQAKGKRLALKVQFPNDPLPSIYIDKNRILELMLILVDNAICYTDAGSVTLSANVYEKNIRLAVCDTGSGIPNAQKTHIFERFYRVNQAHTDKGHHGLGLSIATEIAKNHNATIKVSDNPAGGSIFTVDIPLSK